MVTLIGRMTAINNARFLLKILRDRGEPEPPSVTYWLDNSPWNLSPLLVTRSAEGIQTIHIVKAYVC